ncbi:GMC family oxidoreductase [Cellulomonas sp. P5_C5]
MEFDYVVVGAGLAGSLVASELALKTHSTVLVLESGPPATDSRIGIPARWVDLCGSALDWSRTSTPQDGLDGRELALPRGRVVGGSGAINAMVYIRGHISDYRSWAAAAGPLWGPERVLGAMVALEAGETAGGDPVPREPTHDLHPFCAAFLAAADEAGHRRNPGFTALDMEGVGVYDITRRDGRRWNTASAGHDAAGGPTVLTGAHVTRLTIENRQVTGVEALVDGAPRTIRARREVILCAGAFESPALLLRSGVGPAEHLREVGVPVTHDLPGVGSGLHDHVQVSLGFRTRETRPVLPTSNLGEVGGFVSTAPGLPAPDVQLSFAPMLGLNGAASAGAGFTIGPAVTRPTSRGRLRLHDARPLSAPRIDPGYLSTEQDVETLVRGVDVALDIALAGPLRTLMDDPRELPDRLRTRSARTAFVRANAQTQYHPVGSTAMGDGDDAVVDPRLRVRGIGGLRVVDAGAIPVMPTGNIQAAVLAVAYLGSALILEENHA